MSDGRTAKKGIRQDPWDRHFRRPRQTDAPHSIMSVSRPVCDAVQRKLTALLRPTTLQVVNDSAKHAGHSGNPSGAADAETHFSVTIVSDEFEGKSLVARHRLVYAALKEELESGLHALALVTQTPAEYAKRL